MNTRVWSYRGPITARHRCLADNTYVGCHGRGTNFITLKLLYSRVRATRGGFRNSETGRKQHEHLFYKIKRQTGQPAAMEHEWNSNRQLVNTTVEYQFRNLPFEPLLCTQKQAVLNMQWKKKSVIALKHKWNAFISNYLAIREVVHQPMSGPCIYGPSGIWGISVNK